LLTLGGGVLVACAFPPLQPGTWADWFAPAGVALITAGFRLPTGPVSTRRGLALGLLAGVGLWVPLITWLHVIGPDAWLLLAGAEAILLAPLGAIYAWVLRLPGWPVWCASAWVAAEAWRDRLPFGGFPWGRLAQAMPDTHLVPYVAVGGLPLLTFAVALLGTCVVALLEVAARMARARGGSWPRPAGVAVEPGLLAAVIAALLLAPAAIPVPTGGQAGPGGPAYAEVAAVQGNVPHAGLHVEGRASQVLDNHVAATEQLARDVADGRALPPDVVIWPENSSDLDPYQVPLAYDRITQAVDAIGVPTLVGAVVEGKPGDHLVENSGIVWNPASGPGQRYVKRHPVPFGEYIPFRSVLTKFIHRFSLIPEDFAHGKRIGVMQLGPVRIGDVICFEVAYDGIVRDAVTHGGRVIVVQTNNATYEGTGQTAQQFAFARLRAVEHGRAVIVAATSGISGIIAPDGSVMARSPEGVRALLEARVPLRDSATIADAVGSAPEWALTALAGLAVLAALGLRRRSAGGDGSGGSHPS
jgi:apolipoprotein N-acyltransferase